MSLLHSFINYIQSENLFQKKDTLIVAVSGGVDSVVLCELCHQAGCHFEIAHCNFQLRGEESERDENFVRALAENYAVKVFIKKFDTERYASANKLSIQVAARELRYKWFDELIALKDDPARASYVITAHHANDNIETLLMNFFKGTGMKGLRAILPKQGHVIRPLLFATKDSIHSFAKEHKLNFVEDSSNASDKYTRNYFRNQLIPSIQKVFPAAEENLLNNIERFKDTEILYRQAIDLHKKKLIEYHKNEAQIPVLKLLKSEPVKTILYEIIKDYGFTALQTEEVFHLLKSETGKYVSSATHRIIKNRKWMIIAPHDTVEISLVVIGEEDNETVFAKGKLRIEKYDSGPVKLSTDPCIATLDAGMITFPLLLRKWEKGDYFYPLGMQKKKKLSRFFIDQKMSLAEKEQAWVVESEKRILWIVGKRIDDRFKLTDHTKRVLSISFSGL